MNILVVNDDGYFATGIKKLALQLKKYGNVTVCGPDRGRSASGHSILLHDPIAFKFVENKDDIDWYRTSGMPADCVRLSVALLPKKFDIVFSGINNGLNLGTDIIYSGTVAAAREANIEGIPAVAISTDFNCFDIVDKELEALLDFIFEHKLYDKTYVLNVNFPTAKFTSSIGYQVCRQGIKSFMPKFSQNQQGNFFEIASEVYYDPSEDTDVFLSNKGYITFVPLQVEQTELSQIMQLKNKTQK